MLISDLCSSNMEMSKTLQSSSWQDSYDCLSQYKTTLQKEVPTTPHPPTPKKKEQNHLNLISKIPLILEESTAHPPKLNPPYKKTSVLFELKFQ